MNDLVKRLRAKVIDTGITQGLGGFPIRVTDGLCQEAADHIESQASVIATLENRLTLLAVDRDRIERLKGLCGRAAECFSGNPTLSWDEGVSSRQILAELREASK